MKRNHLQLLTHNQPQDDTYECKSENETTWRQTVFAAWHTIMSPPWPQTLWLTFIIKFIVFLLIESSHILHAVEVGVLMMINIVV